MMLDLGAFAQKVTRHYLVEELPPSEDIKKLERRVKSQEKRLHRNPEYFRRRVENNSYHIWFVG